jgi:hypothetical protein
MPDRSATPSQTPEFDKLAAQGGNPLGGPRPDLTPPKFTITITPTEWPSIDDILGPPPEPPADPEATLEVAPVDLTEHPDINSAIALLDNGAVPTGTPDTPPGEPSTEVRPS